MSCHELMISWSLDEESIYLDDDTLDERMIIIKFVDLKLSKEEKLDLLEKMIIHLKCER